MAISSYDQFIARIWDLLYSNKADDLNFYLQAAKNSPLPVIELGCGTGRVLLTIAKEGIPIDGCDSSTHMLDILNKKILKLPINIRTNISLFNEEMSCVHKNKYYGLAIIPFNTFAYLLNADEQLNTLKNIKSILAENGLFIFDMINPEIDRYIERFDKGANSIKRTGRSVYDSESEHVIVEWSSRNFDIVNQIMYETQIWEEINSNNEIIKRHYREKIQRYSFINEMRYLLNITGFQVEKIYGDFKYGDVTPISKNVIFVSRIY